MAVEIRELVIKAIITKDKKAGQEAAPPVGTINHQQLVQDCVSQVLKIIRQNQNR